MYRASFEAGIDTQKANDSHRAEEPGSPDVMFEQRNVKTWVACCYVSHTHLLSLPTVASKTKGFGYVLV